MQSGGSVATSGFDLLRTLGCQPIALVGLDQAYTERRIHSNGTYHSERWLPLLSRTQTLGSIIEKVVRKRHTFSVPAIGGGEILSDHVLSMYKNWFADALPHCDFPILQFTKRGALIQSGETKQNETQLIANPMTHCAHWAKRLDILHAFATVPSLQTFQHPQWETLCNDLKKSLSDPAALLADEPQLYTRYPFLAFAKRSAEIYIRRQEKKKAFNKTKAQQLLQARSHEALCHLERGLRPYLRMS